MFPTRALRHKTYELRVHNSEEMFDIKKRVPKINPTPKVLHNAGAGPGQLCVT